MDPVARVEDERLHLGIPALRLMSKMDACFQQFFYTDVILAHNFPLVKTPEISRASRGTRDYGLMLLWPPRWVAWRGAPHIVVVIFGGQAPFSEGLSKTDSFKQKPTKQMKAEAGRSASWSSNSRAPEISYGFVFISPKGWEFARISNAR
jgi:hypothetical protein